MKNITPAYSSATIPAWHGTGRGTFRRVRSRACRAVHPQLFRSLGYDGLVYANEIEDGKSAADSYVVFDARQVVILGEETVTSRVGFGNVA